MAATVVASAAAWIGSLLIQETTTLLEVADKVQGLQQELEFMQQYLQDADAKQQSVREVCTLISHIRNLAYDAEDVIDAYIFKVQTKAEQSSGSWLMRFACFLYDAPNIYELGKQIQVIETSLKGITVKLNGFGVRKIPELEHCFRLSEDERYWRQKPRSYPYDDANGEYVVGLEKDIPRLVDVLMGEGKSQLGVLAIMGMGGCGKTTLARKLYNHPYTKECFDCSAWVCISQEWSTRHVLSGILRKVGNPKVTAKLHARLSVEELVENLRNTLEKKSYLVILDDVWRTEALRDILPALPHGNSNRGSKIIITTRNREIVQLQILQQYVYIHEPQPLSEDDGWKLFRMIALNHRTNCNMDSFVDLGKEMLKKCDGLPLAIVALAGILNTRGSIGEWQKVNEAVRSRVMDGTCSNTYGRVGDLLALSYDDLPYDLKPCFLYLGIFPEDCQIPVGMLSRMWIAEGLVTSHNEMSLEDVALQRLEELSHRFMIQVVRTNFKGGIKAIRLHDLLRDLCVKIAKDQRFFEIYTAQDDPATNKASALAIQPRRAAFHSSASFPTRVSHLRSLVLLTRSSVSPSAYIYKDTLDLGVVHQNFKLLRLLSLWGIKTVSGTLPTQIGSLIHLRYLEIRATNITELPTTIRNLKNLLTLDYRNIDLPNDHVSVKIPNVFLKLVLLRHLYLPIEQPWSVIEELDISNMRNLRTLWGVKHEGTGHWLPKELLKLSATLEKLKIIVSKWIDLRAAFSCPSLMSDGLHMFHCELTRGIALRGVEPLSLRQHLHKLILVGEIQMKLSLLLPINLVILELKDSLLKDETNPMKALGLLAHLKLLRLCNSFVGTSMACFSSSFPQLEELYLDSLQNLVYWYIKDGAMPRLKKLDITRCWQLREFPQGLQFVTSLQQLEFFEMPSTFSKKAFECGWSPQNLRLPHNCGDIIKHSDSPIDSSSIRKLYEQLTAGIFLDNKTKKYWVRMQHGSYSNCFMVYASDLLVCTSQSGDPRQQIFSKVEDSPYVECRKLTESSNQEDGALVTMAKLKSSHTGVKVLGKFNTANLSLQVTYEIAWVITVEEFAGLPADSRRLKTAGLSADSRRRSRTELVVDELDVPDMVPRIDSEHAFPRIDAKLTLPNGSTQTDFLTLYDRKPSNEWIHVQVGEFEILPSHANGELQLTLNYEEGNPPLGLIIKGFILTTKL